MNINNKDEPNTAPKPDRWYNLTLGSSFKEQHPSSKFCTLRCMFLFLSLCIYMCVSAYLFSCTFICMIHFFFVLFLFLFMFLFWVEYIPSWLKRVNLWKSHLSAFQITNLIFSCLLCFILCDFLIVEWWLRCTFLM